jgi:hypothetical protein
VPAELYFNVTITITGAPLTTTVPWSVSNPYLDAGAAMAQAYAYGQIETNVPDQSQTINFSGTTLATAAEYTGSLTLQALATVSTLAVSVSASPSSIATNQSSTITVSVTSEEGPVSGASVSLTSDGGTLEQTSGTTDSSGQFTTSFNSSTADTFTITATASMSGYNPGQGSTQVTVTTMVPQFLGYYLAYPNGTFMPDQTANFGKPYDVVVLIGNPDIAPHTYTISLGYGGVSTEYGAIQFNWPEYLEGVMGKLGFPSTWAADAQCSITPTYDTETVGPRETANFVFHCVSKWNWIPPYNPDILWSTVIWSLVGGWAETLKLAVETKALDLSGALLAWTTAGLFIPTERYYFQVSLGSTILGTGYAGVKVPMWKLYEFLASIATGIPAGMATTAAIAGSWAVAPSLLAYGQIAGLAVIQYLYTSATDPSSDYTQVAQPMPPTLLNGTEIMELPAVRSLTGSMYSVAQTLASVLEYQNVTTISIERYAGATAAGDQYYQSLQLRALATYASQRDLFLAKLENQLSILSTMLPPLNSSTIRSAETYLSQNGLPPVEQQLLTGLGFSSSIPDLTNGMEALLNADLLNGTILSQLSLINGTQALQFLLGAETAGWMQQLSPSSSPTPNPLSGFLDSVNAFLRQTTQPIGNMINQTLGAYIPSSVISFLFVDQPLIPVVIVVAVLAIIIAIATVVVKRRKRRAATQPPALQTSVSNS